LISHVRRNCARKRFSKVHRTLEPVAVSARFHDGREAERSVEDLPEHLARLDDFAPEFPTPIVVALPVRQDANRLSRSASRLRSGAFDAELPSPFFGLLDTRAQRRNPATHCHGVGEIDHLPIDTLDLFHQFHVTTLGTLRCALPSHLLHDERREIVGQDASDLCYDGTVNPSRELLVDEERRESSRRHVANI
jgi:hypothetical protein